MSKAFEMFTAIAIVLWGGLRWLKPETTLAEMKIRAEVVECLGLKPDLQKTLPLRGGWIWQQPNKWCHHSQRENSESEAKKICRQWWKNLYWSLSSLPKKFMGLFAVIDEGMNDFTFHQRCWYVYCCCFCYYYATTREAGELEQTWKKAWNLY